MQNTIISSLSFLMIANSTIKSSHLLKNQYEMNLAILPRLSSSILTFQNIWFKQINLIHFTPVTFDGCHFNTPFLKIESNDLLNIKNCINLSGNIKVNGKHILVESTNLSRTFETFEIMNGYGFFNSSEFTSYSNKPVITTSGSEIIVRNCNFSNCFYGGIKSLQKTNLTVSNSNFSIMKAEEGAAIDFKGYNIKISKCIFFNCFAYKAGGAIKISECQSSIIDHSSFIQNKSPQGNSIFVLPIENFLLIDCSIPSTANEIYNPRKINIKPKIDDHIDPTPKATVTATRIPGATDIQEFSPSTTFIQTIEITNTQELTSPSTFTPPTSTSQLPTSIQSSSSSSSTTNDSQTPSDSNTPQPKNKNDSKYLVFVIVICVVVVVIAIVAVTAVLIQKKKNQIYPSDYDGEEDEPKKTTVTVANIHDVDP